MKIIFCIILLIFITNCSSNKIVYWCGDHECVNKKEKEEYFKKTMIVETRSINKNDNKKNNLSVLEKKKIIKSQKEKAKKAKKEKKQKIKKEKVLAKKEKLDEKNRIKEEKELSKQIKKDEKKRKKKEKKLSKIKKTNNEIDKSDSSIEIGTPAGNVAINTGKFNELIEKITFKNKSRPYPDINDIPD